MKRFRVTPEGLFSSFSSFWKWIKLKGGVGVGLRWYFEAPEVWGKGSDPSLGTLRGDAHLPWK